MKRLKVYIAGPISKGDMLHNVRQADAAFLALLKAGLAPWCPHWSVFCGGAFRFRDEGPDGRYMAVGAVADAHPAGTTHEDWMGVDLPWVECSDAVLRLPGMSVGADEEVRHANAHGIPVFSTVDQVIAWAQQRKAA